MPDWLSPTADFSTLVISVVTAVTLLLGVLRVWESPIRRSVRLFLKLEKYITRAREDFWEKRRLGRYVARLVLTLSRGSGLKLFVESGTTAAEASLALLDHKEFRNDLEVYTTNILTALAFAGKERGAQCMLLTGKIDEDYPGVIGEATIAQLGEILPLCDVAVLNTTGFDELHGPAANTEVNRHIKTAVLTQARSVIICFTSRKLLERRGQPMFNRDGWIEVARSRDVHLVMSAPSALRRKDCAVFKARIATAIKNFTEEGIEVVAVSQDRRVHHYHLPAERLTPAVEPAPAAT